MFLDKVEEFAERYDIEDEYAKRELFYLLHEAYEKGQRDKEKEFQSKKSLGA